MSTYSLEVGDITCIAIAEGGVELDVSSIPQRYPNATEEEITDALQHLDIVDDKVNNYFNALYIEANGTKILVDAGMGQNPDRPQIGQIAPNLATVGVQPEDIDIVYITHFHGDHYIGLMTQAGEPTFPNARYITLDTEWEQWLGYEADPDRAEGILAVIEPLRDKFSTVAAGDEIVAGVQTVLLAGHTMGQSGLLITSGDEALLHLVDLIHSSAQFLYPDWQFIWDTDSSLAVKTRHEQLTKASDENLLIMFYHLPFPGLGHIQKDGERYQWNPLES